MFGQSHASSQPSYSHKFAFRGIIPMDKARAALGDEKTSTRLMHLGPGAHALTFPIAGGTMMNVVAFVTDPSPWAEKDGKFVAAATKNEAIDAFAGFGPAVRTIMSLLPDKLDKWAIFDMYDNPVPTYASGRLCLAGDAAHASTPHHGAGAGCGIEDSLALAELLASVNQRAGVMPIRNMVTKALAVYNEMRYDRSQWLVRSSRMLGEMLEWQDPQTREDTQVLGHELWRRCHEIWDFDVDEMVRNGIDALGWKLAKLPQPLFTEADQIDWI